MFGGRVGAVGRALFGGVGDFGRFVVEGCMLPAPRGGLRVGTSVAPAGVEEKRGGALEAGSTAGGKEGRRVCKWGVFGVGGLGRGLRRKRGLGNRGVGWGGGLG